MVLGKWWIDAAVRGGPQTLPIVNINPETEDKVKEETSMDYSDNV